MTNEYLLPTIPAYITVHLGKPYENADNVTLSFPDYIKGVANATLDADMPREALIAIIYAQVSFALNRINSKYYRKQKQPFDITSDPEFDQPFVYSGVSFEDVSLIIDEIFTEYVSYIGERTPIDANVCYDTRRVCSGLSFEGSIELALNGKSYEEILRYYYGNNIYIEKNAELFGLQTDDLLYYPLKSGDVGKEVSGLQIALNRIASNYTTINYISDIDGIYNEQTNESVAEFQRIFDLNITGNVDRATYHKLMYIYDSVRMLSYLVNEGKKLSEIPDSFRGNLQYGSIGNQVKLLQYYLLFVSVFERRVPPLDIVGVFGEKTYQSVVAFQRAFGLEADGIVTEEVWNTIKSVYNTLYNSLPASAFAETAVEYFGNILLIGSEGAEVRYLQEYLNTAAERFIGLQRVRVTGLFDEETERAVREFQKMFGIKETGVVSSTTWLALSRIYDAVKAGA